MYRNISITEPVIKTQLNIDKIETKSKPNFIECLQHSIANLKGKSNDDLQKSGATYLKEVINADIW